MKTNYATAQDIRADAQDLAVVGRSKSNPDLFIYAVKPSVQAHHALYDRSVADASERDTPAFKGHWQKHQVHGITGSSTFLNTRFDQKSLRPLGLWVPSLLEAKALEAQGKLENGVYRDYGAGLYTPENPNKEIAEALAKGRNDMPLVIPFRVLSYVADPSSKTGIRLSIVENPQGIISGEEAQKEIAKLNFKSDSGFHRLDRYGSASGLPSGSTWSSLSMVVGWIGYVAKPHAKKFQNQL